MRGRGAGQLGSVGGADSVGWCWLACCVRGLTCVRSASQGSLTLGPTKLRASRKASCVYLWQRAESGQQRSRQRGR